MGICLAGKQVSLLKGGMSVNRGNCILVFIFSIHKIFNDIMKSVKSFSLSYNDKENDFTGIHNLYIFEEVFTGWSKGNHVQKSVDNLYSWPLP